MLLLCTVVLCLHIVVCTGKLVEYDADLADREAKEDDNEFDAGNGAHGGGDDTHFDGSDSDFDGSDAFNPGSSGDEEEDEDGKNRRHKRPLSRRSKAQRASRKQNKRGVVHTTSPRTKHTDRCGNTTATLLDLRGNTSGRKKARMDEAGICDDCVSTVVNIVKRCVPALRTASEKVLHHSPPHAAAPALCTLHSVVCMVHSVLCSVLCALCSVLCALHSVLCAVCVALPLAGLPLTLVCLSGEVQERIQLTLPT